MRRIPLGVVLAVLGIASAAPLAATRRLPFTDVPEHVAAIAALRDALDPSRGLPAAYELRLGSSPYVLYHLVGGALAYVVGDAALANALLLAATAVALPFAVRALLVALGRDARVAVFAPFLFWNRALVVGFAPFLASVPVLFATLAVAVQHARAPTRWRGLGLAASATVLFFLHLSTWTLLVALAVTSTALVVRVPRGTRRAMLVGILRRTARSVVWLLPSLLVAAAVLTQTRLAVKGGSVGGGDEIDFLPPGEALFTLALWSHDVFRSHIDEACAIVWWAAYVVVLLTGAAYARLSRLRIFLLVVAPFAFTLALCLVTPFQVGAGAMLNVRLAPIVAVAALLPLRPRRTPEARVALVAAGLASIAMAANAAFEVRACERDELGDIDEVLSHAAPGSTLLTLEFDRGSSHLHFPPMLHEGAYHRVRGGRMAGPSFAELPHWPLRYKDEAAPPKKPAFWELDPCQFRNASEGPYYDYVLVRGEHEPFRDAPPGPVFRLVARTKHHRLYAKAPGETWGEWGVADLGPCWRRAPGDRLSAADAVAAKISVDVESVRLDETPRAGQPVVDDDVQGLAPELLQAPPYAPRNVGTPTGGHAQDLAPAHE